MDSLHFQKKNQISLWEEYKFSILINLNFSCKWLQLSQQFLLKFSYCYLIVSYSKPIFVVVVIVVRLPGNRQWKKKCIGEAFLGTIYIRSKGNWLSHPGTSLRILFLLFNVNSQEQHLKPCPFREFLLTTVIRGHL